MSEKEMQQAADHFRKAIKMAEAMPDTNESGSNRVTELLARMLNGDAAMATAIQKKLQSFLDGIHSQRSCEEIQGNDGMAEGVRVVSGTFDKVFDKRVIQSDTQTSFEKFVEERFRRNKIVISFTGWTKPPVAFLKQNTFLKKELDQLSPQKQVEYAEKFYVQRIKKFLSEVITAIKRELPEFNPSTDLGFIYGVTEEGVDRAVEEFAQREGIEMVGLSCYDWAEYIPNAAGKPDVFLAKDPGEFGRLMKDNSNKIVVTGGRSYAANINKNAEIVINNSSDYPRIPADVLEDYGIDVPAFVEGADNRTTEVLNAAKVLKTIRGCNPEEWEVMKKVQNTHNISYSALVFSQVLKRSLMTMYETRDIKLDNP